MLNVQHEGKYDSEMNLVTVKFINKPQNEEDVEFLISENEKWMKKGEKGKVWAIADVSEMGIPSPAMVNIFKAKEEVLTEKYVIGSCVVCPNPFERVTALLFNALTNKKRPIFKTMEEAIGWVQNEQTTINKFQTI